MALFTVEITEVNKGPYFLLPTHIILQGDQTGSSLT